MGGSGGQRPGHLGPLHAWATPIAPGGGRSVDGGGPGHGGAHTLVVILLPGLRLAYQNPALHLTLETAEGLIAALLAYLAAGRFRSTGRLEQLTVA